MAASRSLDEAVAHLDHVDGVMLGRAAYHTPGMLAEADAMFYGGDAPGAFDHAALIDAMATTLPAISRRADGSAM